MRISMNKIIIIIFLLPLICFSQKINEVKIGTQIWTSENLNVDVFRNGDPILQVRTQEEWNEAIKNHKPAYCYFLNKKVQNDPVNGEKYGKLYNWYAISDIRGLAPKGYHLPTIDEWQILINFLGGESIAGSKLKNSSGWAPQEKYSFEKKGSIIVNYNTNGSNSSGFCALGGQYSFFGDKIGVSGYFWSSSQNYNVINTNNSEIDWKENNCGGIQILIINLNNFNDEVKITSLCNEDGYSVRCLKN